MAETSVVRTSCRGCHGVCQVLVHLDADGRPQRIAGDPNSPTSKGYICPKGINALELVNHPDRVTAPLLRTSPRGRGSWKTIGWDQALDLMSEKLETVRRESGPEYFALCQGTGRPYTEFTGRFAHAFGSPNYVGPGHNCFLPRLISSSITLGWFPAPDIYGRSGTMPRCIVFFGCNAQDNGAADGYCGGMYRRALKQAEACIVIDPRRTKTAAGADIHLQLRPGSECALALSLLHVIIGEDLHDKDFVNQYCTGFEALAGHVKSFTPQWASVVTGVPAEKIARAARTMAVTGPAVFLWGNGIDTSTNTFQTGRAILQLMAVTGNIDVPGGMVRWLQPEDIRCKSPMLSHDVLGTQFLSPEQKVRMIGAGRFPFGPGCHQPTFWDACCSADPYRPRAVWLVGTNPMCTATRGDLVEQALGKHIEFSVVSDFFMTPAAELADLVLPAAHWLEQDDLVYFHKVWCVLARKKLMHTGQVRDDRSVMIDLAHRLGMDEAFPWADRRAYLNWLLGPSGMDFDAFTQKEIILSDMQYRKHETVGFPTPSGKVELVSSIMEHEGRPGLPEFHEPPLSPVSTPDLALKYPLILMTGCKTLPFFHSEGRQQPSLRRLRPEPLVAVHPGTLKDLGIADGTWVRLSTPHGTATFKTCADEGMRPDIVQADHAWWTPEATGPDHGWREHAANMLFGHEDFDPDCGAEALKCGLCRLEALA
jgi:anaerobic selenocysteine-containing dehydrogenase